MRTKGKAKPKPEEHADQDDESTENKVYLYYFITICYPKSLDLKTAFHLMNHAYNFGDQVQTPSKSNEPPTNLQKKTLYWLELL